jgi:hypothetical protein
MKWTQDHSILIARNLCGYEIQTSPKGKVYCIDGTRTIPMPDFPNDDAESLSCLESWLRVNPECWIVADVTEVFRLRILNRLGEIQQGVGHRLSVATMWALYGALTKRISPPTLSIPA